MWPRYDLLVARLLDRHSGLRARASLLRQNVIRELLPLARRSDGSDSARQWSRAACRYWLAFAYDDESRAARTRADLRASEDSAVAAAAWSPDKDDLQNLGFFDEMVLLGGDWAYRSALADWLEAAGRREDAAQARTSAMAFEDEQADLWGVCESASDSTVPSLFPTSPSPTRPAAWSVSPSTVANGRSSTCGEPGADPVARRWPRSTGCPAIARRPAVRAPSCPLRCHPTPRSGSPRFALRASSSSAPSSAATRSSPRSALRSCPTSSILAPDGKAFPLAGDWEREARHWLLAREESVPAPAIAPPRTAQAAAIAPDGRWTIKAASFDTITLISGVARCGDTAWVSEFHRSRITRLDLLQPTQTGDRLVAEGDRVLHMPSGLVADCQRQLLHVVEREPMGVASLDAKSGKLLGRVATAERDIVDDPV